MLRYIFDKSVRRMKKVMFVCMKQSAGLVSVCLSPLVAMAFPTDISTGENSNLICTSQ